MLRSNPPSAWLALLILSSLLAACGGSVPAAPTPSLPPLEPQITVIGGAPVTESAEPVAPLATYTPAPPSAVGAPPAPGAITIAYIQDFDTLNPMYAQALSAIYTQPVYNCRAWYFDDQNNPIPTLVQEIPSTQNGGISADGRTITLKLRANMAWSDGVPITANDFVFTYNMIVNPANEAADLAPYDLIESVTAVDPQTVQVVFRQANAAWLASLWHYLLPGHILQSVFDNQGSLKTADWNVAPTVSCGPFTFTEWQSGSYARFVANPSYWLGAPKASEIYVRFFSDDAAKAKALISGDVDISVFLGGASLYLPQLKNGGAQILPVNAGYHEGIFFYLDPTNGNPALQDERVRRAIALGIDRDKIVDTLLGGLPRTVETYWDGTPYLDPAVKARGYDPEKAKALLDEAGWSDANNDGVREKGEAQLMLTYGTTTNEVRQAVQKEIAAQLAAIGFKLELFNYDSGIFFQGYDADGPAASGQLDLFQYAPRTKNYPDPGTLDFLCAQVPSVNDAGENWSWLCDQELDKLLQTQSAQIDFAQRRATLHQASKLIFDKVYFIGLWSDPDLWAAAPALKNIHLSGVAPLYNIQEWSK